MITGAVLVALGILAGWILRSLPGRRAAPKAAVPPQASCGCGHHHSYHDAESGECHQMVNGKPLKRDRFGEWDSWEQVQCPCRRYSGPVPLPEYYAPEIARGAGE